MKKIKNFKYFLLGGLIALSSIFSSAEAQLASKFPKNTRYIAGNYKNQSPFFSTLEKALNDVKVFATSSNPYLFWIDSDTTFISDWSTYADSINNYYVANGVIHWGGYTRYLDTDIDNRTTVKDGFNQVKVNTFQQFSKTGDVTSLQPDGTTRKIELSVDRTNLDTLFLGQHHHFRNPAEFDSTTNHKGGIKIGSDDLIDSIKHNANDDAIEIWRKNMKYKIGHSGRDFYINSITGINDPIYFDDPAVGVLTLDYASLLMNVDSNGVKLVPEGQMEDHTNFLADWTVNATTITSMVADVITSRQDPLTTKSLKLTSNNPTTAKPASVEVEIILEEGKNYEWQFLLKSHGTAPNLNNMVIKLTSTADPTIKFISENVLPTLTDTWYLYGGGPADTINTKYQLFRSENVREFDDLTDWAAFGAGTTITQGTESSISEPNAGIIQFNSIGNGTTFFLRLPDAQVNALTAGVTYPFSFWAYIDESEIAYSGTKSITVRMGDYQHEFTGLTSGWTLFSDDIVATASTTGDIDFWLNGTGVVWIDNLDIHTDLASGGFLSTTLTFSTNCKQDLGYINIDNFIIREISDSSIGWLRGGDVVHISGEFLEDSLDIDGRFVKGWPGLPIVFTGRGDSVPTINGNWVVYDGLINTFNAARWIAFSDLFLEKAYINGFNAVEGNGGDLYNWFSRIRMDSCGLWNPLTGYADHPYTNVGLNIRGRYTWTDRCYFTNIGNDPFSIYGDNHWITNNRFIGGFNLFNGDGLQLKMSNDMYVVNNWITSERYYKLANGETLPVDMDPNLDNKSAILLSRQGQPVGSSRNIVAYNLLEGFSNGLAGNNGEDNLVYGNIIKQPKENDLAGYLGGGDGMALFGPRTTFINNIIFGAWTGISVKVADWNGSIIANNSIIDSRDISVLVKNPSDPGDIYEFYNNIISTDTTGTILLDIDPDFTPVTWDYNIYKSPEDDFAFGTATTFTDIQALGYDANSFNQDPMLTNDWWPTELSPGIDTGKDGISLVDALRRKIMGQLDIGAIEW